MEEVAKALNTKWKGDGATIHFIQKYGSSAPDSGCCGWSVVERYLWDELGVKEVMGKDGYHDEYSIEAMVMTVNPNFVRLPERIKAKKTTINGVDILPAEKTIEIGKKLVNYLADQTVNEIRRLIAEARSD
jgi:hypothetical protein